MRVICRILLWVSFALLFPGASLAANQVSLTPSFQQAPLGGEAVLTLEIDFDDATLGGGIVVTFDAELAFSSFTFDGLFPDDPSLRLVCPDAGVPACAGFSGPGVLIAFGDVSGLSGKHSVGALRLTTLLLETSSVAAAEDGEGGVAGPFQPTPGGSFEPPTFTGATVEAVPANSVPASPPVGLGALVVALGVAGRRMLLARG